MDIPSVIAGIGLTGAGVLIFKLAYKGIVGNGKNDKNSKYMLMEEHERLCTSRLATLPEMRKKIDETHSMVLEMYNNRNKRNGDG